MLGRDVVHKGFRFLWCECRVRERSFGLKYTLDIANCEMGRTPCRNVEWLYRKEVWPEIGMLPCARWPVERRSCSRGYLGHGGSRNDGSDLDGDGFGVRNGSRGRVGLAVDGSDAGGVNGLGAVTADVASLTAPVAGLSGSVERATVRGRAVTGDVTKLAASVALHGLSLAVASEVVGTTALVAAGSTATGETTAAASEATAEGSASTTANRGNGSSTGSRAAPLFCVSLIQRIQIVPWIDVRQGGRAGRKSSSGRWQRHR